MHQALNSSRREIRVIELQSGDFTDTIHCILSVVSLDEEPSYEALSYVWGDEGQRSSITLQGVATSVTTNLKLALQYLRQANGPRVIWADAICINQADDTERSSQVSLMGDIYRGAVGVVAWLGEASSTSDLGVDALRVLGASETLHWDPAGLNSVDPKYLASEAILGVIDLMQRSWWRRVWIVQESILCPNLSFLCGAKEFPFDSVFLAGKNYYRHSTTCCNGYWSQVRDNLRGAMNTNMDTLYFLQQAREARDTLDFQGLVAINRWRQCKDARDRIYGFIGMEMSIYRGQIVPDYSKSTSQVFEEAAVNFLRRGGYRLWSLIVPPGPQQTLTASLPSWAPDWTADGSRKDYKELDNRTACLDLYCAGGRPLKVPGYTKDRGLRCHAVIIATISEVGDPCDSDHSYILDVIISWMKMLKLPNPDLLYPFTKTHGNLGKTQSMSAEDAFWLTICSSALNIHNPAERKRINSADEHRELYESWYAWVYAQWFPVYDSYGTKRMLELDYARPLGEIVDFNQSIYSSTVLRRFFLTEMNPGLMGLAPRNTQVGDVVAVIQGAFVPVILRRATDSASVWHKLKGSGSKWNLVGNAYVQGIMDGEGLNMGRMIDIFLV